jgi:hypothetical protein
MLGAHLLGFPDVFQASLEPAVVAVAALLFSQCNVDWRSFLRAMVSVCQCFDSFGALFLSSVAQSSQQVFDSWSSCYLLLCTSRHLGSSSSDQFIKVVLWFGS